MDVNRTGHARVEGVKRAKNLHRPPQVGHRRAHQCLLQITSDTVGRLPRSNASVFPAQSWPLSHTTARRGVSSRASAIRVAYPAGRASVAVSPPQ